MVLSRVGETDKGSTAGVASGSVGLSEESGLVAPVLLEV